jgi:gas vesicle protein
MKDSTKKLALGTVFAAAAGYIAGILTAPKSGKETREDIKDAAHHGVAEAEKRLKVLHTELSKLVAEAEVAAGKLKGEAKKDLEKAIAMAKKVKETAREILSAAHEGTAEDKDLEQAVKEAASAAEHLKKYLKNKNQEQK